MATTNDYALGSSRREQRRLTLQAGYYAMASADALRWAGLRQGMRVLDIGSGTGALAAQVADLVGPSGTVVGLDASPEAVAAATAEAGRHPNVTFEQGEIATWTSAKPFDAITGRLITMYLPEPASVISRLRGLLRPGGVLLLQEFAMTWSRQLPETALFRTTLDRLLAAFRSVGVPVDLGTELGAILGAAGFADITMTVGGRYEMGSDAVGYDLLVEAVRTLEPVIVGRGIASARELDIDTLAERLRRSSPSDRTGVLPPPLISAWGRAPA